jgi:DNA-binding IclR family transcriptional regulator
MAKVSKEQTSSRTSYSAPAAACAADLLQLFAKASTPLSLAEMARLLGRSKSLVFRVVRELEARDLIQRVDGSTYWLGLEALELGGAYISRASFRDPVRFVLRDLAESTRETANLGVLKGFEVLCAMKHEGESSMVTFWHVGRRMPANCSALGKVLLSSLDNTDVKARFDGKLPTLTSRSIASLDKLLTHLEEIRAQGYAIDDGEVVLGRNCIAVQVQLPGLLGNRTGISVSMSAERFWDEKDQLLERLLEAKQRLDREAGALSALGHESGQAGVELQLTE